MRLGACHDVGVCACACVFFLLQYAYSLLAFFPSCCLSVSNFTTSFGSRRWHQIFCCYARAARGTNALRASLIHHSNRRARIGSVEALTSGSGRALVPARPLTFAAPPMHAAISLLQEAVGVDC